MNPTEAEIEAALRSLDRAERRNEISCRLRQTISRISLDNARHAADAQRMSDTARFWRWLAICAWFVALLCAAGWIGSVR